MAYLRVAGTGDIPAGRGMRIERDGRQLALFNAGGGRFYACGALCPHEDGPLAEGWLESDAVICPWHGFSYDLRTGRCLVDPALGIPVYAVRVSGDAVEVDVP
ncbi:MAG: nitrite reductase (NAD(P)H) small subunit [Candidatus Rokubacteria bacterium]|nr:nitrite reductase (NAD(P)H) small subunit [Candidatus Rokubacteria bacterium]